MAILELKCFRRDERAEALCRRGKLQRFCEDAWGHRNSGAWPYEDADYNSWSPMCEFFMLAGLLAIDRALATLQLAISTMMA